jgi:endonuclease G
MVPQAPNLNRKIWAGIEAAVRALAIADGELYVITGPEIDATAVRLAGKVSVPSKTWKAVDEPGRGAAAYVCTNTAAPICSAESIAALSAEIGFDPFPGLPEALKATAIALPEPTKGGELADVQEGDR